MTNEQKTKEQVLDKRYFDLKWGFISESDLSKEELEEVENYLREGIEQAMKEETP